MTTADLVIACNFELWSPDWLVALGTINLAVICTTQLLPALNIRKTPLAIGSVCVLVRLVDIASQADMDRKRQHVRCLHTINGILVIPSGPRTWSPPGGLDHAR
ncbi:hypothetical protein BDN67DRAFT_381334 [Paxillus ammoniavirescens]|nr:hypothetical protein BDN67DRAFT_381334 [Paxillus ammoniavirescens]